MSSDSSRVLHIGHSPDPDDAFMWYPLADFDAGSGPGGQVYRPCVDTGKYRFVHVLEDIESLNRRAEKAELEITALSMHQYAYVANDYALTSCGSSMGEGYGPMIVSKRPLTIAELPEIRLAVPGERTTAFLTASVLVASETGKKLGNYEHVMFDQIIGRVAAGEFDAGLIIHEGQLTYQNAGLEKVIDLGQWWTMTRGLPLPLGGNAIRRDLAGEYGAICGILYESICYALEHREEAIAYAMHYARDMDSGLADQFVGMYVNDYTLDYGERGRRAVQQLYDEAEEAGLIPSVGKVDFISPEAH